MNIIKKIRQQKYTICFLTITAISLNVVIFSGCSSSSGNSINSESSDSSDNSSISDKSVVLSISAHPENTLMAIAGVALSDSASVVIEYSAADTSSYQRANEQVETNHEIIIIGMRAETVYTMTAVATFNDGTVFPGEPVQFTTGELPEGAPEVALTTSLDGSVGGVTFFGLTGQLSDDVPVYWGVDEQGEIIWYLSNTEATGVPVMRDVEPGVLLAFFQNSVRKITTAGETIETYDISSAGIYHHEARLIGNGHLLVLVTEFQEVNGQTLAGDRIVELDVNGDVIWEWSTFDHLDTTRFPGELSMTETRSGALDWTHSNSLFYIEEEDSILLSVRSQSWVVKIDHNSGEIISILGDDSATDANFEHNDKFFTLESGEWMTNQHAAAITTDGEILLYDNRNESGGETLMSRAVKYLTDESAMTAEQTWEGVTSNYTSSMGDVDELSNGNILVSATGGRLASGLNISELSGDASGEIVWSVSINNNVYRAERISWDSFLIIK